MDFVAVFFPTTSAADAKDQDFEAPVSRGTKSSSSENPYCVIA